MKLPVWFQAPAEPLPAKPIRVDDTTTPRQLAIRTIFSANKYIFPGALLSMGHQIGEALVPVIMGLAIDRALATGDMNQLLLWVGLLGLDFAMLSYSYRFGSRIFYLGMQSTQHMLRTVVTDRLLDSRGVGGKAALPGVSLSIASSDVMKLSTLMTLGVYLPGALAGIIFCAVILLTISWPLGLAILLGVPLLLLVLDKAGGPIQRRTGKQQALAAEASGRAADLVTGYRVIKGIGAEREAADRYRTTSQEALAGTLHAKTAQGVYAGTMSLVTGLFIAALAVAAGLLALNDYLTIGGLITVVGLTQFIMSPLQGVAAIIGGFWPPGLASAKRVLSVLQAPHTLPTPAEQADAPTDGDGRLVIEAVDAGTLSGFDLTVEPGECVGVVGEGEAARALTELLMVRREPDAGRLSWHGMPLRELEPEQLRRQILVAPHSADLFDGSIIENVALPGSDPSRVDMALDVAGCREFLAGMPDGLDTAVGEGGVRLSGGQRQRVALARALAQPAPMLVLHDPTTAVDSVTEAGIAERLKDSRNGQSTVIITSSPVLLTGCDRIVHINSRAADELTAAASGQESSGE